jgi:hypothetical protein
MEIFFAIVGVIGFWVIVAILLDDNSKPSESSKKAKVNINKTYKPRLNQSELEIFTSTKTAATLNKTTHAKELINLKARQKARDKAIYTYWNRRVSGTDFLGVSRTYYRWESPYRHTTVYYPISSYNRFIELQANREKYYR